MHELDALTVGRNIRTGEVTSVEVTGVLINRIESLSHLKAFVTVTPDTALAQAAKADEEISRGEIRSPLHGVPIAFKDLLATAGVPTSNGMTIYADDVPDHDATVVRRLLDAGTVMLGKLKLTEGAFSRHHPDVEPPVNPWDETLWTGVSSSGSGVATAAGLCYGSLGSDPGGSIRFPSAANGIVGLKPTWGRVSRFGAFPLAYSLDHIGPMTRSVADAAAMLQIMAGFDDSDTTSSWLPVPDYLAEQPSDLAGVRIGVDERYIEEGTDKEHIHAVRQAIEILQELGCEIVPVSVSGGSVCESWAITTGVEAAHAHRETYPERKAEYGAIAGLIDIGLSVDAGTYMQAEMARRAFCAELAGTFEACDLLICPSMPRYRLAKEGSAEMDGAERDLAATLKFTAPFDYSGSPTLSIPWAAGDGVPASVQLIGGQFEEKRLIGAGLLVERARGGLRAPSV